MLRLITCAGLLAMAGCAAKGDVVPLNLQAVPPANEGRIKKSDVTVIVLPFEDARPEQGRLGTRAHFWGGRSYYDVPSGKPSEAIAESVADYLRAKGWKARAAKSNEAAGAADVVLSGKVLGLAVDAESKFMRTNLAAKSKVAVQAQNAADESIVRMTLNGSGSDSVFWYNPKDAEKLLNEVVAESLEKLVMDTKFENQVLRLK
ncbi:MAG: YajG family lipoprotein [Nitrospiraceae bacterium]